MPDVFISYSRDNQPVAELIANSLMAEGLDVWWDGVLRAGDAYDEVIEEKLRRAGAVVVVWSKTSTKSKWVRAEATVGERHSTIVPALIEECDVPIRFELMQTANLCNWSGDRDDRNWRGLVADIRSALEAKASPKITENDNADNAPTSDNVETVFWSTIKDTHDPAELKAYLKRYENGRYIDIARRRLAALSKDEIRNASIDAQAAEIPRPLIAISIFAVAMMFGIVMLLIANAIHIGFFTWTPSAGAERLDTGAKEIGFYSAINWSLATLVLMPAAWTLIYLALASLRDAWDEMIMERMLVATDFSPVASDHKSVQTFQKHLRLFVIGGIAIVTALMVMLSMSDHAQVAGQFYGNPSETQKLDRLDSNGYPLEAANIERDWMVASFLSTPQADKVNITHNNAFALTTYIVYVGLGIGSLLSFGLVIIGVGAAFLRGVAQNYGLQIIPSITSIDRRCGFEAMQRFFGYAYTVALIGCVMIYLMGVQNLYLRSPDPSIFAFMSPDFAAFQDASNWREAVDAAIGFLFAENVAKGTRNVYAWIFGFFIFAVFIGGYLIFLRQGAFHGRSIVLNELRSDSSTLSQQLANTNEQNVIARLNAMHIWPLTQPSLRASLAIMAALIASFVFYKLGALIILGLCAVIPTLLRGAKRSTTGAP
ncbi:MAG: toll/interleukin-1 receptor domain-containing protein [Marinicaulis sp.]|nr:toll/interleukin-1 receptor domain-containing protein [Marinicaulis sp.]